MSRKKLTQQKKYSLLGLGIAGIEKDTGLQRKDFAEKLGLTAAYLIQLITGQKNNPSDRFFMAIAREFGVNKVWLQTRKGQKYEPNQARAGYSISRNLTAQSMSILIQGS